MKCIGFCRYLKPADAPPCSDFGFNLEIQSRVGKINRLHHAFIENITSMAAGLHDKNVPTNTDNIKTHALRRHGR